MSNPLDDMPGRLVNVCWAGALNWHVSILVCLVRSVLPFALELLWLMTGHLGARHLFRLFKLSPSQVAAGSQSLPDEPLADVRSIVCLGTRVFLSNAGTYGRAVRHRVMFVGVGMVLLRQ